MCFWREAYYIFCRHCSRDPVECVDAKRTDERCENWDADDKEMESQTANSTPYIKAEPAICMDCEYRGSLPEHAASKRTTASIGYRVRKGTPRVCDTVSAESHPRGWLRGDKAYALSLLVGADPLTVDTQTEILPEVKTWIKESLEIVFSDFGSLTDDDACESARFAVAEPSGLLLKDRLVERSESSGFDNTVVSEMYESILGAAIPGFALRKSEKRPSYYGYGREKPVREPALDGHKLAAVVQHCLKLNLDQCINQLIGKILQEITIMDTKDFPATILPLLESLLLDIKKGEIKPKGSGTCSSPV
ncbi:hypothetical protein M436DRAFT_66039 [Aureobasidium namibiae CBS 147.97]|uniref:Uncharacterized protein n=1 Tax=Aureobasidium namibiae CBS 147.97 TaxID=1043004 RepID=A0A074WCH6_9PEZI